MRSGVNKVILVGNLGSDPDKRTVSNGNPVTNITVATSDSWKDKTTGEPQERTEWHRVVFFNKLAEISGKFLRKGSKVYLEGALRTRKWQDKSGEDRYTTEIIASEMQMLDSRGDREKTDNQQNVEQSKPKQQQAADAYQEASGGSGQTQVKQRAQSQYKPQKTLSQIQSAPDDDAFDDEIPF